MKMLCVIYNKADNCYKKDQITHYCRLKVALKSLHLGK